MSDKSEISLVEAAQNGHLDSFAALYERYYGPMVALAYSVLADIHLAEDAAQQSFATACKDISKLKSKYKFGSWLAGICRNTAKQIRDRNAKTITIDGIDPVEEQDCKNDNTDIIRNVVWQLRPFYREPVVLRYYNGLSYEQISAVLGISQQAVNGRLHRAKRKIEKDLKSNGYPGGNL